MHPEKRLTGKVAFVTGAASGIGRAAALAFAREGASVVIADLSEGGNAETANLVHSFGGQSLAVQCDVADPEQVKAAFDKTGEAFGRLDLAFNNAGIEVKEGITAEASLEDWDRIMNVNLRGVFLCLKHEIPLMLKMGAGAIVNMSSIAGLVGLKNSAAYTASKHGVIGLTRAAAIDYAPLNIRINAVCPGLIDTPLSRKVLNPDEMKYHATAQPMARVAKAEEVAEAALWLCSDSASFVTGHALTVDGGFTAA